jgi:hypothetical protein
MMKIYKKILASILLLSLLFTSCSKEEDNGDINNDSEMANLSFSTILLDFNTTRSQQKDHVADFPICSEADPAYVTVILTGENYEGPESLNIPLTDSPGDYDNDGEAEYFTLEDDNLELPAGLYTLEEFTVYDENDNLIWVAPTTDGSLGSYVDSPLPKDINLVAGTKKYVDVEMLCYDKRMVNEYGYLFFELENNLALDFCFFANYCDENGRHFTADYSVDIWYGVDDSGIPLYTNVGPTPAQHEESGEYNTDPLCFALPELPEGLDENDPYVYFEATLSDWDDNYGDVDPLMISGTLSYSDIIANFIGDEAVDYRHLRFGCGDDGGEVGCDLDDPDDDCDNDGVPNREDQCPGEDDTIDVDEDGIPDCIDDLIDSDKDGVADSGDNCPSIPNSDQNDSDSDGIGDACDDDFCDINNANLDCDNDGVPNGVDQCPGENDTIDVDNDGTPDCIDNLIDSDGDGIADSIDDCPNTPANTTVDEDGCEIVPEVCEIGIADQGCSKYFLSETDGFVEISQPDGAIPDPYFLIPEGGGFDDRIGSITIQLSDDLKPVVTINLNEGYLADDYVIEVRDESGSEISCVAQIGVDPPSGNNPDIFENFTTTANFDYPFQVSIEVNACTTD